jgi:hypothetical protein
LVTVLVFLITFLTEFETYVFAICLSKLAYLDLLTAVYKLLLIVLLTTLLLTLLLTVLLTVFLTVLVLVLVLDLLLVLLLLVLLLLLELFELAYLEFISLATA